MTRNKGLLKRPAQKACSKGLLKRHVQSAGMLATVPSSDTHHIGTRVATRKWACPRRKSVEMPMSSKPATSALPILLCFGLFGCGMDLDTATHSTDAGTYSTSTGTRISLVNSAATSVNHRETGPANPAAGSITPYDFPVANAERKALIADKIGNPAYPNHRIGQLYGNNLAQVYHDFGIDPGVIMTCDARHQQALDLQFGGSMMKQARNYFCQGEFDTPTCHATQYKRVYRGYCLDVDDSMDWLALQSVVLNAAGRSVHVPPDRTFYINQVLIIPSNTRMVWLASGETRFNGRSWERPGASFIRMQQEGRQLEPLDNLRKLGFSTGTAVVIANMPFVYAGKTATRTEGIAGGVELYYPHIDAGNLKGENALSLAQSVQNVEIVGGVLKNARINATDTTIASAGGKALQCEAGCRELHVSGINILDSHIGINSNAAVEYEIFKRWTGRTSDLVVEGVVMDNVDIPVNVYNNFENKAGTQRVHISNFYIHNSGRMPDSVYLERRGHARGNETFSARVSGNASQYFPAETATNKTYDSGLVTSRGGYWVIVQNGKYYNDVAYGGIDNLVSGWGMSSKIDAIDYNVRFNCALHPTQPGC